MKKRKTPERKCVVTLEMRPKHELIRVVRNKDGEVFVDESGKQNGRGAYLILTKEVVDKAEVTNALGRQLNAKIPVEVYDSLRKLAEGK